MKYILSIAMLLAIALLPGCTEDPEPSLNFQERERVDSLYHIEIVRLKPFYDSLCAVRSDSAVAFKVDSMMQVRNAEIQRYLDRLRQEIED